MNMLVTATEITAFIGFVTAAVCAFLRYKKTREATYAWLPITAALSLFALATLTGLIGSVDDLAVLRTIEELLSVVGSTFLLSAFCFYRTSREMAKCCRDGKSSKENCRKHEKIREWLETI